VHHDQILGFSIEQEKTNVTAEYLRRMGDEGQGAVKMLQEIAAMVPKLEDIALGDADLYIEIKPKHTATFWDDDKEEDRTKTLVDKRGPLLTFHNAASGASFAVELDALKDGRLEAHRFYDGDPNGKVSLDRQGQPLGLIDSRGIESFVFELSWALSDLREMVAEQKA
jgi:hypothetical protein